MNNLYEQSRHLINTLEIVGFRAMDASDGRLNMGGCAYYASIISKCLTHIGVKHFGLIGVHVSNPKAHGIEEHIESQSPDNGRKRARGELKDAYAWNICGFFFDHVGLMITLPNGRNVIHDSTDTHQWQPRGRNVIGLTDGGDYVVAPGFLTPEELQAIGLKRCGWNNMFRTHNQVIREIRPILAQFASEYVDLSNTLDLAC